MKTTETNDRLAMFLYLLLRDKLPAGEIEDVIKKLPNAPPGDVGILSNGFIGDYAVELSAQIRGEKR